MATFVTAEGEEVSAAEVLRYAGSRAFVLRDGVWTDTGYDPAAMTTPTSRSPVMSTSPCWASIRSLDPPSRWASR